MTRIVATDQPAYTTRPVDLPPARGLLLPPAAALAACFDGWCVVRNRGSGFCINKVR
jgi:hypothetical protein